MLSLCTDRRGGSIALRSIQAMRLKSLPVGILVIGMFVESPASAQRSPPRDEGPDLARVEELIVTRTNQLRDREGHQEVRTNRRLRETAQSFADFMARTGKYGHTADGRQPSERAEEQGYDFCLISENIGRQFSTVRFSTRELATRFFEGWEESPQHRRNMLDSDVTEIGVGASRSEESGRYYAVQMFGRPQTDAIEFSVTNRTGTTVRYTVGERTFPLPPGVTRSHQNCRPPELTLHQPDEAPEDVEPEVLRPGEGDHYLIQSDRDGRLTAERAN